MGTSGGVLGIPTLPLPVNREVAARDVRSSAAAVLTGSSSRRSDDGGGGGGGPSMSHASDITSPGGSQVYDPTFVDMLALLMYSSHLLWLQHIRCSLSPYI